MDEKCCCNCLHCARWQTSKGVECHCDLSDRYLSYLDVMDTDNSCCRWEKETKWDMQKQHDKEVYNKAIDDFKTQLLELCSGEDCWNCSNGHCDKCMDNTVDYSSIVDLAEELKAGNNG